MAIITKDNLIGTKFKTASNSYYIIVGLNEFNNKVILLDDKSNREIHWTSLDIALLYLNNPNNCTILSSISQTITYIEEL